MNRLLARAASAALVTVWLLALAACGNAESAAEATPATIVADVATAGPTKPPPVISANPTGEGAVVGAPGESTSGDTGDDNAPALPTPQPTAERTAVPTVAMTDTPAPTPTPIPPTAAPVQPTAAPVIQPTAVPPTAVPPTAAPPAPGSINGISASHFAIQDRASLTVNGDIWFEFHVANATSSDVPFDALGVMPKKDGVDRPQWYQHSWGGNDDVISPGGLTWDDHINLPEAGNYTLRLVICFDGPACQAQNGTWHTLSQEIPVTIR